MPNFGSQVERIKGQVVAGFAGGRGAVEVVVVIVVVWSSVVVKVAAGCPGMNGTGFLFCKAHAMGNLCERALNGIGLEVSGTLIAGERDCGSACLGLGVGLEVVDGEECDEMGEEGMLWDAVALGHRGCGCRRRRRG